jgi:RNA polymerase sigma-70 factor (ECF subfamily)
MLLRNESITEYEGLADPDGGSVDAPIPDFPGLYKEHFHFVWSSARHLGATPDTIDDVVQDVFMVAHAKLGTLRRPESLRSWLYGIIRRTLSTYRRARRLRDAAEMRLGAELKVNFLPIASPLELMERNTDIELLKRVLAEMSELKREIFIMVEILGMTVPEVTQGLGIPLDTAYSRLRKARLAFNAVLARLEAWEGGTLPLCRA